MNYLLRIKFLLIGIAASIVKFLHTYAYSICVNVRIIARQWQISLQSKWRNTILHAYWYNTQFSETISYILSIHKYAIRKISWKHKYVTMPKSFLTCHLMVHSICTTDIETVTIIINYHNIIGIVTPYY